MAHNFTALIGLGKKQLYSLILVELVEIKSTLRAKLTLTYSSDSHLSGVFQVSFDKENPHKSSVPSEPVSWRSFYLNQCFRERGESTFKGFTPFWIKSTATQYDIKSYTAAVWSWFLPVSAHQKKWHSFFPTTETITDKLWNVCIIANSSPDSIMPKPTELIGRCCRSIWDSAAVFVWETFLTPSPII